MALLAFLACLAAMKWAAPVLIPLLLGLMLSYALTPLVDQLVRWRLPRAAGAAVLLLGIVGGLGSTVYALSDDASAMLDSLPSATQKLHRSLTGKSGVSTKTLEQLQQAAAQLEETAAAGSGTAASVKGVTRVVVERPQFDIKEYLWTGTLGLAAFIGQVTIVCFIAYFLMASGDSFRRKLVKVAGATLSQKKVTVKALDEITAQIQRYLLVQLFTSVLVGVATGLAYWALGMEYAAVWGVAAAVLNLIPYLGSIVVTAGSALLALLQFGSIDMAFVVGGASVAIHVVSGNLVMPWLTGRIGRMNPVVIFAGVLAWGWLWGIPGLLLGVPILMAAKAVCDHVDGLKAVGEFLGR